MIEPRARELLAFPHRRRADDLHHRVLHVHDVTQDPVRRIAAARGWCQRIRVRETFDVPGDHAVDRAELLDQQIASRHANLSSLLAQSSTAWTCTSSTC